MSKRLYTAKGSRNVYPLKHRLPEIDRNKLKNESFYKTDRSYIKLDRNLNSVITSLPAFNYINGDFNNSSEPSTPCDFFSDSDTCSVTRDIRSEESDSSTGSILTRANEAATKYLTQEWEKIERTIYSEAGDKVTQAYLIEECNQWRAMFPQLRVLGKGIKLDVDNAYSKKNDEEIIAINYSDTDEFSESEERKSSSNESDLTLSNSPREVTWNTETNKHVYSATQSRKDENLSQYFGNMLQITPIYPRQSANQKNLSSIVKSDMKSSKWMRSNSPDSFLINDYDRYSARSFITSSQRKYSLALSENERSNIRGGGRVSTAFQRVTKLQPVYQALPIDYKYDRTKYNTSCHISLPPLDVNAKPTYLIKGSRKRNKKTITPGKCSKRFGDILE